MSTSILVVDDDRLFREIVTHILTRHAYQTVAVESAAAALEQFEKREFQVVITDMVMPDMDGMQLVARLKDFRRDQEIIMLTQREQPGAAAMALRAGLSDYLLKPVDESELIFAIRRCCERAELLKERERLSLENRDYARSESIHQLGLSFLLNPDLEWLQERIASDFASLAGAQSAALWVLDDRGQLFLRAYRGLLDKRTLPERHEPSGPFEPHLKTGAPWQAGPEAAGDFYVPLLAAGEVLGLVQLSDALAGSFGPENLEKVKRLAEFAAVGIKNGRRLLALQRLGLRDKESAAYNQSYFTDYASKEIYKARRYGRTFSLLTISLDNLPQIRERFGADRAKGVTRGVIHGLSQIVRDADVIAKASDQELYLLLPETDFFGATIFSRRAIQSVTEQAEVKEVEALSPLGLVFGASTFPRDGDDFDELIHRCRQRMNAERQSLFRHLMLEQASFWEAAEVLLGSPSSARLPLGDQSEPSRRGRVAELLFEQLQDEVSRELLRDPIARGVVYVGTSEVRANLPIVNALHATPTDFAPRVYLLGRRRDLETHPSLTPVFLEGDEHLSQYDFLLWLSEYSAYALIQRKGDGGTWGFHTSDSGVVDGLVSKLQDQYALQPY